MNKLIITALAFVVAVVVLLFTVFTPLIHPFFYMWYAHSFAMTAALAVLVGAGLVALALNADTRGSFIPTFLPGVVLLIVSVPALVLYMFMGGGLQKMAYLEDNQPEMIDTQADTTGVRYIPYEVAQNVAKNNAMDPYISPGEMEPYVEGNEAYWVAPREPVGLGNLFAPQKGIIEAKSTSDVEADDSQWFSPGIGTCCMTNTIGWQNVKEEFFNDYSPEEYTTRLNGEQVVVQPYLGYYSTWRYLLPTRVPYWKGVLIYHGDGTRENLRADEAGAEYPDGRLAPWEMAKYFSSAYPYKDGLVNKWFYHVDQPDTPHLGGGDSGDEEDDSTPTDTNSNQFPFLIPTEDGPSWFSAVEPRGKSRNLFMAYYYDATTGKPQVHRFEGNPAGPDRAASLIDSKYQELKNAVFIEPRPIVKNDNLYWMLTSTTSEYQTVSFTAVMDAETEEVYRLESMADVEAFVKSGTLPKGVPNGSPTTGTDPASGSGERTASKDNKASDSGERETNSDNSGSRSGDSAAPSDEELVEMLRDAADRLEKQE